MPVFKCLECGGSFFWQPRWAWIRKNYEYMIAKGTANPGIRDYPIILHPKHLHPSCPRCGGTSDWLMGTVFKRLRER